MAYLFDRPQFPLIPARDPMKYANVSNLLEVSRNGRIKRYPIEVHTSLFSLMRYFGVPVNSEVTLYLDRVDGRWIFGMLVNEDALYDLWHLPDNKLPSWITV